MSALNTAGSTVAVEVDGTLVPLPNDQVLDGFTADGASETFTVPATGNYLIAYAVRTTTDLQMSSRIMRNGAELAGSVVTPAAAADSFTNMQLPSCPQAIRWRCSCSICRVLRFCRREPARA